MSEKTTPLVRILPARFYGRDPALILEEKEMAIARRVGGCKGCCRLNFDASGDRIIANCSRGLKVGRKGKCTKFKETE